MKINEGMFAVKLYELERQYGRMQSRLRLCQQDDHQKIRQELQRVMEEYQEDELLLLNNVENSRSPAVAALAGAQLDYSRRAEEILEQELPSTYGMRMAALRKRGRNIRRKLLRSMQSMPSTLRYSPCVMR